MKTGLQALLALLSGASCLVGQDVDSSHVFPQVADGRQPDGSYYSSLLWIMNVGEPATCTFSVFGLDPSRVHPSTSVTVPGGGSAVISTDGQGALATGYGRLDCSHPVTASLTYSLFASTGARAGMATVFPAAAVSYAMHRVLLDGRLRYGIAIANDSDAPGSYFVEYSDSAPGRPSGIRKIEVPPRSRYTAFVDEIVTLPAQGSGKLEITALGTGAASFRVTLLLFDQMVFTTLVPVTVR
jgi:hypothetical protein